MTVILSRKSFKYDTYSFALPATLIGISKGKTGGAEIIPPVYEIWSLNKE